MERGGWGVGLVGGMGSSFFSARFLWSCGISSCRPDLLPSVPNLADANCRRQAAACCCRHPPALCAAAIGHLFAEAKYLLYTTLEGVQRCPGVCATLCDELAQRLEAKPDEQDVPRWVWGLESVLAPVGGLRLKRLTVWHAGVGE